MKQQSASVLPNLSAASPQGLKLPVIEKNPFPRMGNRYATCCVALSTLIMAYGGMFGFISILVFYALWLPWYRYKHVLIVKPTHDILTIMLFPLFACVSVFWSIFRSTTLYCASEYASLIICTVIMAKIVRTPAFIRGVIIGTTLVLIASLISGNYGVDPFSGNYSLTGLFNSKNQVGLFAEIGIFLCVMNLFIKQNLIEKLIFCVFPFAVSSVALYLCKSASSTLSLAITFSVIIAVYGITRLPRSYRFFTFAFLAIWSIALVTVGIALDWQNALFKLFGKDATLTGRTVLWDRGIKAGWESPLLGHGYSAYWVRSYPPAEQLWYEFDIPGRSGFHFHNLYVELFVETGFPGLFLMGWVIWRHCSRSFSLALRHGMQTEYVFALGIAVMFLIRSFVELDLIGTFSIGPLLFFSLLPRLATHQAEMQALTKKRHGPRP